MKRKIELLAPGGDIDSIKTAILAGANAVYCGLSKFNARNRAANINFENLQGILRLAHQHNCEVFLTLNIIITDSEIPALIKLLNRLINTSIDAVIVQDLGMLYLLTKYFPTLKVHASTQLTTHNEGQIKFLSQLKAERVNLSRELNINEIKLLTAAAHQNNMLSEVFVHGSYCISFSGICYMSSVHGGNSGNRGRCSQPCREKYISTLAGENYPLNLKDNSAYFDLKELDNAGVDSLKIEGRIKEFEYVYTVVNAWRKQIDTYNKTGNLIADRSELYKVFNRDFSNGFLKGNINKDLFIDNPMSYSTKYFAKLNKYASLEQELEGKKKLYQEKEHLKADVKNRIDAISLDKIPLNLDISGQCDSPLKVFVKTPEKSFEVFSNTNLKSVGTEALTEMAVLKRLKAINDTEYFIQHTELNLSTNLYLPFKDLTSIKKKILFVLNDFKEVVAPVIIPKLKQENFPVTKPSLSVLISSVNDIDICKNSNADIYFSLPNSFKNRRSEFVNLFKTNDNLIPWFPSVLIGEDYRVAVKLLEKLQFKHIVTNNSGIALEACKRGISWIAGPYLNIANSYALISLQENFNCQGAFLSNELSKQQMYSLKAPAGFKLYYSIYHPIVLMTSRQCLFQQLNVCDKNKVDGTCIQNCEKLLSITDLKKDNFIIEKSKGNYHRIFNAANMLNFDIVNDLPNRFTSFFIDLSDIKTETKVNTDKCSLIELFEQFVSSDSNSDCEQQLKHLVSPTTNTQYKKGF